MRFLFIRLPMYLSSAFTAAVLLSTIAAKTDPALTNTKEYTLRLMQMSREATLPLQSLSCSITARYITSSSPEVLARMQATFCSEVSKTPS